MNMVKDPTKPFSHRLVSGCGTTCQNDMHRRRWGEGIKKENEEDGDDKVPFWKSNDDLRGQDGFRFSPNERSICSSKPSRVSYSFDRQRSKFFLQQAVFLETA
ncbi:hypothetical protein ABW19_dt0207357 [Dactylella cylindrospora]|nr:hypothetical protein ABW19_dt0207357 [Dactylella cylindrospora]